MPVLTVPGRRRRRAARRRRPAAPASAGSRCRAAPGGRAAAPSRRCARRPRAAPPSTVSRASTTPRKSGVSTSTAGARPAPVDRLDDLGEVAGAAVGEVVAVDRGDHRVAQLHRRHRLGDALGLVGVDARRRPPGGDRAEAAAPGADVAEDHEGGGAVLAPALVDVGAAGLLADRVEIERLDQPLDPVVGLGRRQPDAQPGGAPRRRRLGVGADLDEGLAHGWHSLSEGVAPARYEDR